MQDQDHTTLDQRYIVLVPLQHLPHTGVAGVLQDRAETLQRRVDLGTATPDDEAALAALRRILDKPADAPEPPLLLRTRDVARLLDVSETHAAALIVRGEIPSIKVGGCRRVRRTDLLAWLDAQGVDR